MTFHILGIVTPTDELTFFRGVGIPPTGKTGRVFREKTMVLVSFTG